MSSGSRKFALPKKGIKAKPPSHVMRAITKFALPKKGIKAKLPRARIVARA